MFSWSFGKEVETVNRLIRTFPVKVDNREARLCLPVSAFTL